MGGAHIFEENQNGCILQPKWNKMASVTIKNLPETLYKKLKAQAKINNRSINGEILNLLKRETGERDFNVTEFI